MLKIDVPIDISKLPVAKQKHAIIEMQKDLNSDMLEYLRELYNNKKTVFIKGNTPSLKNSKEIMQLFTKNSVCHKAPLYKNNDGVWYCTKCNQPAQRLTRPTLIASKTVLAFKKETEGLWLQNKPKWVEMRKDKPNPFVIGFYFIRKSKHSFDYNNASHILLDLMTDYQYYVDDDMIHVIPEFLGYHYDKENPGAIITFMDPTLYKLKQERYL
jgi:ribosomal protein L37AE/L43A